MSNISSIDFHERLGSILDSVEDYINATYSQHYVGESDIQTIDVWESMNIAEPALLSNSIKYLSRYGKKDGKNPKDLLKTLHYTLLLYYFDHVKSNNVSKPN